MGQALELQNDYVLYYDKQSDNKWNNHKLRNQCTVEELEQANLERSKPNEIILDLEDPAKIDKLIAKLDELNFSYEIWATGSRGYHAYLIFDKLEEFPLELREAIRLILITFFECDVRLAKENQFIASKNKQHFKTGVIKILYRETTNKRKNVIHQQIIDEAKKDLENQKSKTQNHFDNSEIVDVRYKNWHLEDQFVQYVLNNTIAIGDRNSVLFKNLAIGLAKEGLDYTEENNFIKKVISNCPGKTLGEFDGWLKKAKKGLLDEYNKSELNKWAEKYKHNVELYVTSSPLSEHGLKIESATTLNLHIDMDYRTLADRLYQTNPFFYNNEKMWWFWNTKEFRWIRVDDVDVMNMVDKSLQWSATTDAKIKSRILEGMKRVGREHTPIECKKTWVQFSDTIVDILTGERFKASPKYFVTNPIPWSIGIEEETPNIDLIFKEWVGEEYVQTLYEIVAYCTLAHMPINRIFCFIGEGNNGKTTYLKFIEKLLGKSNITASDIDKLTNRVFETSKLYKKLAVTIGEIDNSVFRKTSILKLLSGDDLISAEFKGIDGFDFHNYATPLIATNKLPESKDESNGFYRRWCIIDFPNEFVEKQDVLSRIPEEEFRNLCAKIPAILSNLIQRGHFDKEGNIKERKKRYMERSSNVSNFIKEHCELNSTYIVKFSDFYDKYIEYLRGLDESGNYPDSKNKVGRILNELCYDVRNDDGKAYRLGIRLKTEVAE